MLENNGLSWLIGSRACAATFATPGWNESIFVIWSIRRRS